MSQDSTSPAIFVKVFVYDFNNSTVEINIRDFVMEHYGWDRVSYPRIAYLKEKLEGKKVTLLDKEDQYLIEELPMLLK